MTALRLGQPQSWPRKIDGDKFISQGGESADVRKATYQGHRAGIRLRPICSLKSHC